MASSSSGVSRDQPRPAAPPRPEKPPHSFQFEQMVSHLMARQVSMKRSPSVNRSGVDLEPATSPASIQAVMDRVLKPKADSPEAAAGGQPAHIMIIDGKRYRVK